MTNTTQLTGARSKSGLAKLKLTALVTLAAVLFFAAVPSAHAGPVILLNRRLVTTDFETNNMPVTATCGGGGCMATVPLLPVLPVMCPAAVGGTCTFYIHLETNDALTTPDMGRFQFLVGGAPPFPGPTDAAGFFIWDNNDPVSGIAAPVSHSYAVTASVKNVVAGQVWPIMINLGCVDMGGAVGCTTTTFFSNLQVTVHLP